MKPPSAGTVRLGWWLNPGGDFLDTETKALVERWILAFCETPILIDPDLMRRVLDDAVPQPHPTDGGSAAATRRPGDLG